MYRFWPILVCTSIFKVTVGLGRSGAARPAITKNVSGRGDRHPGQRSCQPLDPSAILKRETQPPPQPLVRASPATRETRTPAQGGRAMPTLLLTTLRVTLPPPSLIRKQHALPRSLSWLTTITWEKRRPSSASNRHQKTKKY